MITGKTGIKITPYNIDEDSEEVSFLIQNDELQYIRLTDNQMQELVDMIACLLYDLDSAAPHVR